MRSRRETLTISGNLTTNPELRNLPSGQNVGLMRIAHDDPHTGEERIDVPPYLEGQARAG